ncbi:hypothetical protein ACROYT_G020055 [Oculina patagonica]
MKKSCFGLVFLVLLTLFKGVEAGSDENLFIYYFILPFLFIFLFCCGSFVLCCHILNIRQQQQRSQESHSYPSQQPRSNSVQFNSTETSLVSRELIERERLPRYSEACVQQHHSVPPRQSGSNSEVLQIVNLQSTSHSQAHGAVWLPITRERLVPTANPPELLTVELPPLLSGEEPPPPYFREEPSPAYSGEESSTPYTVTSLV